MRLSSINKFGKRILRSSGLRGATMKTRPQALRASKVTIGVHARRVVVCESRLAYDSPRNEPFRDPLN